MVEDIIEKGAIEGFIGNGTTFEGVISLKGTVRIDGEINGEINGGDEDNLFIAESAVVKANVKIGTLIVHGHLEGNVEVSKNLQVSNKGKILGSITSKSLLLDGDGTIEGATITTEEDFTLGESVVVKADAKVGSLFVHGEIKGNIVANKKIDIANTGKVYGNISTPVLHIDEGGILESKVSMAGNGKTGLILEDQTKKIR